jgi:hypothetical protein
MKNILEAFACGNVNTRPCSAPQDNAYDKAIQTVCDSEERLFATLDKTQQTLLKTFIDAQSEINLLSETDRFIYGYRLGVLMTMEVFIGKDDLIVSAAC